MSVVNLCTVKNYNTQTFTEIISVDFRPIKSSNADSLSKISPGTKLGEGLEGIKEGKQPFKKAGLMRGA